MEFARPPPNMNMPPPNSMGPPMGPPGMPGRGGHRPSYHRPFGYQMRFPPAGPMNMTQDDFDGKRLRKSVMRKTVDYNAAIIKAIEGRVWQRDWRDRHALQPDAMYMPDLLPPPSYAENPTNAVTTRFVKTATNKMRCPIFAVVWTPEGRRLITGASSGEFTLWNGLTFNFETILQAHDSPVRSMVWSHGEGWMVTGDHSGYVKYWQSNMNNVKMFQAHKEAVRGISFSPSDSKIVTCSDDGTLRIFDFYRCQEEKILRGHGADVKCVQWHPTKALIVSGSKDNQQPIKLWDPKSGLALSTLHAHKSTVMDLKWNENGNWLITASRDHLLKLFDIRKMGTELQIFRGHKKEASSVAWHPTHEGLFSSGGSDGAIMFWNVGTDKEVGCIEGAHESIVWTLAWHPLGHILCSGSNDHTSKFWTRNRPGDQMRDKYNLNTLPPGVQDEHDLDEPSAIPGICPEDKVEIFDKDTDKAIPGLDLDTSVLPMDTEKKVKKVPYSKPIPRNFQVQWNTGSIDDGSAEGLTQALVESVPGVVPLQNIAPSAIIIYGKLIPVEPGSRLEAAIAEGPQALKKFIASGEIEELHDVMPHLEDDEEDTTNAQFVYPTNTHDGNADSANDDSYDNYNNDRSYRNNFNGPPPGNFNKPPSLFDTVFDPNNPPFVPPPPIDNSYSEEQDSYDNGQNEEYQDADAGGDSYDNQGDTYGNLNEGYSNDGDGYGNEGDGYINEGDSYGNQGDGFGNQGEGYGNQGDGFGNQGDGFGNQGDNYGNQRGGYVNQRWQRGQRGFQRGMGRGRGMNMNGHGRGRGEWTPRARGPRARRPGGNRPYWRGGRNK